MQLKDENGLVLRELESLAEVARYFERDPKTVRYLIQKNKPVPTRSPRGEEIGENKFLTVL